MESKEKDNEDKKENEKNEIKYIPIKDDLKDKNQMDLDIDNYHEKTRHRYTVRTNRPLMKQQMKDVNNSFYGVNELDYKDFLKKKHLFIVSKYEQIVLLSSDIYKKIENNLNTIKELENQLKQLKEEKKKKQNDIVNYLSNKESLEEIYKNKLRYIIKQKNKIKENELNLHLDKEQENK